MAKMHVFVQNLLWLTASTICPNARSLSATCAAGVGEPAFVPLVWSFGSQMMERFGILSAASNFFNDWMNCAARRQESRLRMIPIGGLFWAGMWLVRFNRG